MTARPSVPPLLRRTTVASNAGGVRTDHGDPVLEPMLSDLRARRFRYNDRNPYAVLDELQSVSAGFCDEVGRTTAAELERTATRSPGERRTALWLIRQAMHEGVHHRRGILRLVAGPLG